MPSFYNHFSKTPKVWSICGEFCDKVTKQTGKMTVNYKIKTEKDIFIVLPWYWVNFLLFSKEKYIAGAIYFEFCKEGSEAHWEKIVNNRI